MKTTEVLFAMKNAKKGDTLEQFAWNWFGKEIKIAYDSSRIWYEMKFFLPVMVIASLVGQLVFSNFGLTPLLVVSSILVVYLFTCLAWRVTYHKQVKDFKEFVEQISFLEEIYGSEKIWQAIEADKEYERVFTVLVGYARQIIKLEKENSTLPAWITPNEKELYRLRINLHRRLEAVNGLLLKTWTTSDVFHDAEKQ